VPVSPAVSTPPNSGNGFTANFSDGYTAWGAYTFTQTFKNSAGTVIGSQVIKVSTGGSGFTTFKNADDATITSIPAVTLDLSKQVQK